MPGLAGWLRLTARLDKRNVRSPGLSLDELGEFFRICFEFSMMELMSLSLVDSWLLAASLAVGQLALVGTQELTEAL